MLRRVTIVAFLAYLFWALAYPQASKSFSGRVFDARTSQGIANLEVKLTPPRASNSAILIGSTDQTGAFHFPQVQPGPYLLEVFQGPNLLYRAETDISKVETVEIPIQRR